MLHKSYREHIIYAIIELNIQYNDYPFNIDRGVIGIDINNNCIALNEIDAQGDMIYCHEFAFDLNHKNKNQRKWIIENTVKQILDYCLKVENH